MTPTEAAWLAGYLDGEGSFMIRSSIKDGYRYWFAMVSAASTNEAILERCMDLTGGKITQWQRGSTLHAKPSKIWMATGRYLNGILPFIIPHLIVKREAAEILLSFRLEITRGASHGNRGIVSCPKRNARREHMRLATKALNHRGTTAVPCEYLASLKVVRNHLSRLRKQGKLVFVL